MQPTQEKVLEIVHEVMSQGQFQFVDAYNETVVNGIGIMVRSEDEEAAKEILNSADVIYEKEVEESDDMLETADEDSSSIEKLEVIQPTPELSKRT